MRWRRYPYERKFQELFNHQKAQVSERPAKAFWTSLEMAERTDHCKRKKPINGPTGVSDISVLGLKSTGVNFLGLLSGRDILIHTLLSMVCKDLVYIHFKFNFGRIPSASPQTSDTMEHFSGSILNLGTSNPPQPTDTERLCF